MENAYIARKPAALSAHRGLAHLAEAISKAPNGVASAYDTVRVYFVALKLRVAKCAYQVSV